MPVQKTEKESSRYWAARHSIKPKKDSQNPNEQESSKYPGISNAGVEHARKNAAQIYHELEQSEKGTVMFLGGASDEVRTESTARVFGERLKELAQRDENYLVITKEYLKSSGKSHSGLLSIARKIRGIVEANPDKKIVIDVPISVREFYIRGARNDQGWLSHNGKYTEYTSALLKKYNNDSNMVMENWIANNGKFGNMQGPKPVDVARRYQSGLKKLEHFANTHFVPEGRPLITAIVGHSFDLDAYLTYIAGDGKVDLQTYHKIANGKGVINEAEGVSVYIDRRNSQATVSYRGKQTTRRLENIAAAIMLGSFLLSVLFYPNITGNAIGIKNNSYSLVLFLIGIVATIATIVLKKKNKKKKIRFYF